MKKIVKKNLNISDMTVFDVLKQCFRLKRMPVIDIAEGPRLKYLLELFYLHHVGYLLVKADLRYPRLYRGYARIRNSLVFRYNHYRNQKVIKENSNKMK